MQKITINFEKYNQKFTGCVDNSGAMLFFMHLSEKEEQKKLEQGLWREVIESFVTELNKMKESGMSEEQIIERLSCRLLFKIKSNVGLYNMFAAELCRMFDFPSDWIVHKKEPIETYAMRFDLHEFGLIIWSVISVYLAEVKAFIKEEDPQPETDKLAEAEAEIVRLKQLLAHPVS